MNTVRLFWAIQSNGLPSHFTKCKRSNAERTTIPCEILHVMASIRQRNPREFVTMETLATELRVPGNTFKVSIDIEISDVKELEIIARLTPRERSLGMIGLQTDGSFINRQRRLYVAILNLLLTYPDERWSYNALLNLLAVDSATLTDALHNLITMGNVIVSYRMIGDARTRASAVFSAIKDTLYLGGIKWDELDLGEYLRSEVDQIYQEMVAHRPDYDTSRPPGANAPANTIHKQELAHDPNLPTTKHLSDQYRSISKLKIVRNAGIRHYPVKPKPKKELMQDKDRDGNSYEWLSED